jgi:hypothetical protein
MTTYDTQENLPEHYTLAEYLDMTDKPHGDTITDTRHADWYCRKIAEIKNRLDNDAAQAEEQIMLIQNWLQARREKAQRLISWLVLPLQQWLPAQLQGKEKSTRLPHGTVGLRAQQPEFEKDEAKLLAWIDDAKLEALVTVKRTPNWELVKKFIEVGNDGKAVWKPTGEVLDFITVTVRADKFYLKDNSGSNIEYTAPATAIPEPTDEIGAIVDPYPV